MKKNIKVIIIIVSILIICLLIGIIIGKNKEVYNDNSNETQTDIKAVGERNPIKFKNEYESLNGTKVEGKSVRNINIDKNNPFIYSSAEEVAKKIENKETFTVYFGFKECPWCRSVIESLIEVSSDLGLEEIYYVDVKDIRDTMKVNDDGKVETDKKGTSGYYKLLKLLDNVLDDYTLTNKDNEGVSANEKRIYAPTVISIVDGKVEDMTTGISDAQTDAYMKLTDEMKKETYNKFKCVLECVTENKNSCSIDKKC